MAYKDIDFSKYTPETALEFRRTARKVQEHFREADNILISVSGGSDSDTIVHMVCTFFPEFVPKCHFVFVNTGLEYAATKRHLCELEKWYNIKIERIRGKSVVWAVKHYGVPILSKFKSKCIEAYSRGVPWALRHVNNQSYNTARLRFSPNQKLLCDYIAENNIKISSKCCDVSKKVPANNYVLENQIDLRVTGERKCEGGIRAQQKTCFAPRTDKHCAKFMPLFFWTDEMKSKYKSVNGILYSDCYEVWGMKRTGCVGCPFNLNIGRDLLIIKKYEPKMYKACLNVFGEAYRLTDQFQCRRKRILPEYEQLSLFDEVKNEN